MSWLARRQERPTVVRAVQVMIAAVAMTLAAPGIAKGQLVYSTLRDGVWRLSFQASIGSGPQPITTSPIAEDASSPALSANGRVVAFELGGSVLVCTTDRANECRRVESPGATVARPAWHPATGELTVALYISDGKEEDADIYMTRRGLRELAPLLKQTGVQDYPAFSRDGRLLAYTVAQTASVHSAGVQVVQQIWLADMVTGNVKQLIPGNKRDVSPSWGPSDRVIGFASDRSDQFEIWTVRVDGTGLRRLTSGPGAKTRPRWSPDGKSIMFTMAREGRLSLWIIDADGSNLRQFEPFGPNADVQLRDADWR